MSPSPQKIAAMVAALSPRAEKGGKSFIKYELPKDTQHDESHDPARQTRGTRRSHGLDERVWKNRPAWRENSVRKAVRRVCHAVEIATTTPSRLDRCHGAPLPMPRGENKRRRTEIAATELGEAAAMDPEKGRKRR